MIKSTHAKRIFWKPLKSWISLDFMAQKLNLTRYIREEEVEGGLVNYGPIVEPNEMITRLSNLISYNIVIY